MRKYLKFNTKLDASVPREQKFELYQIQGDEGLCKDFTYELKISSLERLTDEEIEGLIGSQVSVEIQFLDNELESGCRFINGIIYQLTELGMSRSPLIPQIWRYRVVISSWMKQLEYVKDCRIFQKKGNTSITIITELLQELGFRNFKQNQLEKLPLKEYTVMYNETVSKFIRRLLQEDGIIWHFEHTNDRHTLVFSSDSTRFPEIPQTVSGKHDSIKSFCKEGVFIPAKDCMVSSYNWENPPVKQISKAAGTNAAAALPSFHYPADFLIHEEGEKKAEYLQQAIRNKIITYKGESTIRALTAGKHFKLFAPTLPDLHQKAYLIKDVFIEADNETYKNRFIALPPKQHFRLLADEDLAKPKIFGTQTATVVGENDAGRPSTERLGRVKVRFQWDHYSPENNSQTSAYIRVAGTSAGSQRGFIFTPRVGDEVVVSYEDGNPDKPLIIGAAYSDINPPPHSPVTKPYTSVIRSDGGVDANQITLTDMSDSEILKINARKDMNYKVGHDLNIEVENELFIMINDETINATENITTDADGSIIEGTSGPMSHIAGSNITNMALGAISKLAGAAIKSESGAATTNTAILSIDNKAKGAVTQMADAMLANTSAENIASIAENIKQNGILLISNISEGNIKNTSGDEIKHKALIQKVTVDETNEIDTGKVKIKGLINNIN